MSKGKKKSELDWERINKATFLNKSKKPKHVTGAVLKQLGSVPPTMAPERAEDEKFMYANADKARNTVGAVPIIGGLTSAVMGISDSVRGQGTSVAGNFASSLISPTASARNAKDSGLSNMQAVQSVLNPVAGAILSAKGRKKQLQELAQQRQIPINQQLMANSATPDQTFKHGGMILAKSLHPMAGGGLEPISDGAVQVKADNPARTDSVELQDAYVDHNEIIDKENRVFSDEVKLPSGKSIAQEAKRLNKMKREDYESRFANSNQHIDSKLDKLFAYQESMKGPEGDHLAKGGKIHIKKSKVGSLHKHLGVAKGEKIPASKLSIKSTDSPAIRKKKQFAINAKKWHHADGGTINDGIYNDLYAQRAIGDGPVDYSAPNSSAPFPMTPYLPQGAQSSTAPDYTPVNNYRDFKLGRTKLPNTSEGMKTLLKEQQAYNQEKMRVYPNKKRFDTGGKLSEDALYDPAYGTKVTGLQDNPMNANTTWQQPSDVPDYSKFQWPQAKQNKFDWGQAANMAITTAPNVANALLQRKLKGPASPQLETDVRLGRVNADAQLASANRAFNQAQAVVTKNTAQGSNLTSAVGNLLSKRLEAQNQTYGDLNNLNTQIGNQEVGMNQGIRARNAERISGYKNAQAEFSNRKLGLTSQNISNLSTKLQSFERERAQRERDRQSYEFLQSAYGDSGVLNRLAQTNPELYESVNKALGKKSNRRGGKLTRNWVGGAMC